MFLFFRFFEKNQKCKIKFLHDKIIFFIHFFFSWLDLYFYYVENVFRASTILSGRCYPPKTIFLLKKAEFLGKSCIGLIGFYRYFAIFRVKEQKIGTSEEMLSELISEMRRPADLWFSLLQSWWFESIGNNFVRSKKLGKCFKTSVTFFRLGLCMGTHRHLPGSRDILLLSADMHLEPPPFRSKSRQNKGGFLEVKICGYPK